MPDRQDLKDVIDDVKAALHRRFAGIQVRELRLIYYPAAKSVPPPQFGRPLKLKYILQSKLDSFGFRIRSVPASEFPRIKISRKHISGRMNVNPIAGGMVEVCDITENTVPCDLKSTSIRSVKVRMTPVISNRNEALRLRHTKVIDALPKPVKQVRVHEVDTARHIRVHSDLDIITGKPLEIEPAAWSELGKEFIIECWDVLRRKAIEELGHDPGRDLEMAAVFRDVTPADAQNRKFDEKTRKLLIYQHDSPDKHAPEPSRHAIIIGLVRGTGVVLQVEMPDQQE